MGRSRLIKSYRRQKSAGFGLIEVAFAIALISLMLLPILSGGIGSTVVDNQTTFQATESLSKRLVSAQNLVNEITAMQNGSIKGSLPSTAGSTVRIPGSGTTTYTSNGETVYWFIQIKEMSHRVDASGNLIDRDGSSVSLGSEVRTVPAGNNLYYATLFVSENSDGSSPYMTTGFYLQSTSCTGGVCPTLDTDTDYLIDQATRYGIDLTT